VSGPYGGRPDTPDVPAPSLGEVNSDAPAPSLGELFGEVSKDLSELMRQELALAKAEATQTATRAGKGVGMFAGAALGGYFVLLFLSVAGWWGLGNVIGRGWSALVMVLGWAVIAAVLAVMGRTAFAAAKGLPHTTDSVKRIPDALTPNPEDTR
jgi:Putative Actinobacterial Holin-X, holin superfamily III